MENVKDADQILEKCAAMYNELNPEHPKKANDLVHEDFDEAVAFWSR